MKKNYYRMIYQEENDVITNEIVEMNELEFEGDFYAFENEKGNGIIMKIDSDGELYTICADECQCFVECETNNECRNGEECVEYVCVDQGIGRKGMDTIVERKVAHVAIVPIVLCTFGLFSSFYLAQEYGKTYFNEKCEKACPVSSEKIEVNTDVEVKNDESSSFKCYGRCELSLVNLGKILNNNKKYVKDAFDSGDKRIEKIFEIFSINEISEKNEEKIFDWFAKSQEDIVLTFKCEDCQLKMNVIAENIDSAKEEFTRMMDVRCKIPKYDFSYNGVIVDLEGWVSQSFCITDIWSVNCT